MTEELKVNETSSEASLEDVVQAAQESSIEEVSQEPEWQPNYKFSVMNKDYEFPEYIRPAINKDNYNEVLDTYTKAYGLEHAKARAERLEAELNSIKPMNETQSRALGYLGTLVKNKDIHTLVKELNLPEEEVIKYAYEKAKMTQMSPEEREIYEQRFNEKQKLTRAEMELNYHRQQAENREIQARFSEIGNIISSGQIKDFVADYNSRLRDDNAFLAVVAKEGFLAQQKGRMLSNQEAVDAALRTVGYGGYQPSQQGYAPTESQSVYQQAASRVEANAKPIIPNIRGNSTPMGVGKRPTSLDELKKLGNTYRE